ncbi:Peroxisomal NADH pyrophosphatase nudt12 [Entophlyctis luteolus]|nr:Peroxisomal NADH pyrophosphatase nudt12 [Entophlyctis luteolus]KAJ3346914.1 Peroxisomal NADH pyrophosphatase nudt12 [Entophlyctis luteolus]
MDDAVRAIASKSLPDLLNAISAHPELVSASNERKWTLLHFAARFQFPDAARALIDLDPVPLDARTDDGKRAIDLARDWGGDSALLALLTPPKSVAGTPAVVGANEALMYFGASTLDRRSDLRDSPASLLSGLEKARILPVEVSSVVLNKDGASLLWLSTAEVNAALSRLDSGLSLSVLINAWTSEGSSGRLGPSPSLLFLGVTNAEVPLFAIDASAVPALKEYISTTYGLVFAPARPSAFVLADAQESAILAQSKAMIDWHVRSRFCPLCGSKTRATQAGYKRVCTSPPDEKCPSHGSVQNSCFPRTDPVAIVCITNHAQDRVLLGRQKSWPPKMYSCIAGFMEPGESIEAAARREAREETGVRVGRVQYFASQPWPFPSNLMVGMFGIAVEGGEDIELVDKELEDAKWFTRAEVLDALGKKPSAPLAMAMPFAIAHQLVKHWAEGRVVWHEDSASVDFVSNKL